MFTVCSCVNRTGFVEFVNNLCYQAGTCANMASTGDFTWPLNAGVIANQQQCNDPFTINQDIVLTDVAFSQSAALSVRLEVFDAGDVPGLPLRLLDTVNIPDIMQIDPSTTNTLRIPFGAGNLVTLTTFLQCPNTQRIGIGCSEQEIQIETNPIRKLQRTFFAGNFRNVILFPGTMSEAVLQRSLVRHETLLGPVGIAQTYNRAVLVPHLDDAAQLAACNVFQLDRHDVFSFWRQLKLDCEATATDDW